jgi:GT2 family glycosyltransferase
MARGEDLLLLNPDAQLAPHSIGGLAGVLHSFPGAGMVGPLVLNPDGTEQAGGRRRLPTPGRAWIQAFGLRRLAKISAAAVRLDFIQAELPLPAAPVEVEAISGACMLVQRAALDRVGGLDEGYFLHCEDLDWCQRFRQAGWRVVFVPEVAVVHDKGACSRTRPLFVQWHLHRGMVRYYRKFLLEAYPAPLHVLVVAAIWARFATLVPVISLHRAIAPLRRWIAHRDDVAREV